MAEYIERDIFINNELIPLVKQLDLCHPKQKKGVLMAIQKLNETPTADVVEVVRCCDCKHKVEYLGRIMCDLRAQKYRNEIVGLIATEENHFCSYGELKEREGK